MHCIMQVANSTMMRCEDRIKIQFKWIDGWAAYFRNEYACNMGGRRNSFRVRHDSRSQHAFDFNSSFIKPKEKTKDMLRS
ncbi:hypothetical protein EJB05_38235 [Eragrostis curvula]|uniref:Uncharacterized protein n=1 Tax=Eragrostis curvula TaxID=38414 RepID=A0A5J9TTX3_9POAL|nr:hypothetical protein EJB05_38225 [Eragrostis curvula]TVU14744.1 hypothetical protein EJB05_38235 [Eragrostis curvula]